MMDDRNSESRVRNGESLGEVFKRADKFDTLVAHMRRARKWMGHVDDCESGLETLPNRCPCGFNEFMAELDADGDCIKDYEVSG